MSAWSVSHLLRARCPEPEITERGVEVTTFADFVRAYRGADAAIQITRGKKP